MMNVLLTQLADLISNRVGRMELRCGAIWFCDRETRDEEHWIPVLSSDEVTEAMRIAGYRFELLTPSS
jgi:hypothetical protein